MSDQNGSDGYRPHVRVRVLGREAFLGPGVARLLRNIHDCGSVSSACDKMKLSYSKGRGMLRNLERETGRLIVRRCKGGAGGGSARLTEDGERLLEMYEGYEDTVHRFALSQFDRLREFLETGKST